MWVVRLSDKQLEVLRALLRSEEHLGPALRGAVEALDLACWDDLPQAELPWDELESAPGTGTTILAVLPARRRKSMEEKAA